MQITSNGSKWAGEAPDPVEKLIEVLKTEVLDPRFARYGNFFYQSGPDTFNAFGNFLTRSHGFNITGTLEEMLPLARALKAARQRPEYLRVWSQMYRAA
jgi:hypothetical protein